MIRNIACVWSRLAAMGLLLLPAGILAAPASSKLPVVPKWQRFEQSFRSSFVYSNALQDASFRVAFVSPMGETNEVDGFWDGGRTWRVRFSPDQAGHWKFKTACSDTDNDGLHNQTGEFICSANVGLTRFHKRGQVRVAPDRSHLEHMDRTPFFWLADTVWDGMRVAEPEDWRVYAGARAAQGFNVAQWAAAPGEDARKDSAYSGFAERIAINPGYFKRLDAKLDVLSQAGILSAIAPLFELPSQTNLAPRLPDDQAELLVRYVVARWGAEPVAWLIAFEGDSAGKNVARWKRLGQAVFGSRAHAPVILYPGETYWVLDEFRDQKWVDAFGFQSLTDTTEDAFKWTVTGPIASEWKKLPLRPLIPFTPRENALAAQSGKRFTADDARHAAYLGLLLTGSAGISYSGQGVANWDATVGLKDGLPDPTDLPMWRKAMFMPGAKQISFLGKFLNSVDFWKLRPGQKVVASQPGQQAPQRYIAAAATEANTLSLIYVPEDRTLELVLEALPRSPSVTWFNPRTGENNPAVAVVAGNTCQFPTPDSGDWLLVTKAGK